MRADKLNGQWQEHCQWQWHRADADTDQPISVQTDPEIAALINREREWERQASEYAWGDTRAVMRGVRNALLVCVPAWLGIGRVMGWW